MPIDGRAVGRSVFGHVEDDVVIPVGCDCWAWYGPVGRQAFPLVPVWCAVDLLESQPVFNCAVRVKDRVVVVGVDVVLAPALAGGSGRSGIRWSGWWGWKRPRSLLLLRGRAGRGKKVPWPRTASDFFLGQGAMFEED